jgi:hypothetical protein
VKHILIFFFFLFHISFLESSCRDSLADNLSNDHHSFDEQSLNVHALIAQFKNMGEETLLHEKVELDQKESQDLFQPDETHLLKRWLVEERLKTDRADSSKEALVDHYFALYQKSQDPDKTKVNHPIVYRARLIRGYRDL